MLSAKAFRAIVSGQRKGPLDTLMRCGLAAVEGPYSWAVQRRNRRFDRGRYTTHRVDVPVISVGNLTLGGTGKTPMVAWLAKWFRQHDVRVAIVSRGYGAGENSRNDEARELEARLPDVPHIQNADRVFAARTAIDELESQLILLDDGFQHRRLARDLDLVLIDATEPFGFDRVFPRGTLREPASGLQRADAVALTRCSLVQPSQRDKIRSRIQDIAPAAICLDVDHRPTSLLTASGRTTSVDMLAGQRVAGFCGIGNPAAFQKTVQSCGLELAGCREFADHHRYDRADVESLIQWTESLDDLAAVVCTHKDLVKVAIDRLGSKPLYALTIDLEVQSGLAEFENMLHSVLKGL